MQASLTSSEISILMNTPLASYFAELLGMYSLNQGHKFEVQHSVLIDSGFREYHAFTLEGIHDGELEISFSLYRNKMVNGQPDDYNPIQVEFLRDGENVEHEQLYLQQWAEPLKQIKAELFKNTFPEVEV